MVAFALLPVLAPVDVGAVVDRVRRDYAGYAEARAMYAPETWSRLEREARTGEAPLKRYLTALLDPSVAYTPPQAPGAKITGRVRLVSGPELVSLLIGGSEPPTPAPKYGTALLGPDFRPDQLAGLPAVVLDLREPSAAVPSDAFLGAVGVCGRAHDPGYDLLASPANLATWRKTPEAFPGGPDALAPSRPGSWVPVVRDRTILVTARPGPRRVALLVGSATPSAVARWVALARTSPRVRVFGTPTPPVGLRGVRRFDLGSGASLSLPTFRRRVATRVIPDEDASMVAEEFGAFSGDLALIRADQWCRLGE